MRPGGISRRSPNTCAECRARKVKCDGSRNDRNNGCTGCKRLKLDCSFSRVGAQVDGTVVPDVSLESRKKKIACTNCRSLKAKCDGELPSCTRCLRKRRSCLYPSSRNIERETNTVSDASVNTHKDQITAQEPSDTQSVLPSLDKSFVLRMIEAFFQHIHPIPVYSYLHKASLVQRFESGQLDHALLLALASTTCELLDMGADLTAQSVDWMSHVERSMMKEYCRPSVIKIQISVMLINHCIRQGRLSNAFMLHAVASRGAFALGLNHEAPKFGFLARESRRRLMWALYIIDTRLAGGMSDFTLCSSASMRIQLPCHERNFEFDLPQDVEVLESAPGVPLSVSVGSLAIYMRLMWFRHRILQATKGAVLSETMSVGQLTTSIEQLAKELSTFETSLPQSLQLSSRSLQLRVHSSRLGPFLLVHVWLRQCYCDLYRIALTGLKEALPSIRLEQVEHSVVQTWRRNCFDSAMALAGIFRHFTNLKNSRPVIEHDIIACAYQCARLLLHITRCYAEVLHIDYFAVQENAQQCLAAVRTMQTRSLMGELIVRIFFSTYVFSNLVADTRSSKTASKRIITEPTRCYCKFRASFEWYIGARGQFAPESSLLTP